MSLKEKDVKIIEMKTFNDVLGIKEPEEYKCPHFFKKVNSNWVCTKCNKDPKEIYRIS